MTQPTAGGESLPPFHQYAQRLTPGHLGTTDTVASEVAQQHQLASYTGGSILGSVYACSCSTRQYATVGDVVLHLVEMGVEAGVAAMAQLAEATTVMSPVERAERDLVGYIQGLRETGRAPDWHHWRDALAWLVIHAADEGKAVPIASTIGAELWWELESAETLHSIRDDGNEPEPITDDRLAAHVRAYAHSSSAQVRRVEVPGPDGSYSVPVDTNGHALAWQQCPAPGIGVHDGHAWERADGVLCWCAGG